MSVDTEPVTAPAGSIDVRRRGLRWPLAIGVAVALIIAFAMLAVSWMLNYQPLTSGGMMGVSSSGGSTVRESQNFYGVEYQVVEAEPSSPLEVLVELAVPQDAPSAVTVERVGSPVPLSGSGMVGFADSAVVSSKYFGPQPQSGNLADGPVRIEPGQVVHVTIELNLPTCDRYTGTSARTIFTTVPVTYTAFGIEHRADIPFGYALSFDRTPTCPA